MAIIPKNTYPGQTIGNDPNYPHGKARNIAVPGDRTGTPWEEQLVNDLWGFCQALLARGGVTPNGFPDDVGDSDYVRALDSAYASTMQDALDRSFAAGDAPTLLLPGGNSMNFASNRTILFKDGIVHFWQWPDFDDAIRLGFGARIGFAADDGVLSFLIGAPAAAGTMHGITTPPAPNTASKAALVRAPGTGTQATEWAKWEDLDSNPAWSPTPTYGTNVSGMGTVRGTWSQVGKSVSFSANGTVNISSAGQPFTFTIPAPKNAGSTFFGGGGGTVDDGFIDGIVASGGTITISGQPGSTGTSGISWSIHGQYAAA